MDIFWQHVLQIFEYMLLSNKFQTNSEPGGLHTKQVQDFNKKNLEQPWKVIDFEMIQGPTVSEVGTCQNAKYLGLAQKRLNSGNFY